MKSLRTGARGVSVAASVVFLLFSLLVGMSAAQSTPAKDLTIPPRADNRNEKKEPFRMIGNIYWVGHTQIGSFLIKTPKGDILMDTTSAEQAPWVRENLQKIGVKPKDIKIILNSHPHAEHMGGLAMFKELTGAQIITSNLTAEDMATGGRNDFREDGSQQYKPVMVDRIVQDGGKVELGGMTLVAHLTPGHTKGCTTWTTTVAEDGKTYNVVFFCGVTPAGPDRAPLFNNPKYPNIVADFEHTFQVLHSLPCDVFLYARATTVHVDEKEERLKRGEKPNPFVDPQGCRDYIKENEDLFNKLLSEQKAALNKKS